MKTFNEMTPEEQEEFLKKFYDNQGITREEHEAIEKSDAEFDAEFDAMTPEEQAEFCAGLQTPVKKLSAWDIIIPILIIIAAVIVITWLY